MNILTSPAQFFSLYSKRKFMEKMNDLKDLLKHEIEDLYSVEEQIIAALPKMIEKANNPTLKEALSDHLKETEQHKNRLDKIMKNINPESESNGKKKGIFGGLFGGNKHVCKGMKGIIEEGETIMNSDIAPEALDAAIVASAQKVEHYEICGYGTARTFARELGMEQVAKQLEQTLNEEYAADDLLTQLAVQGINVVAESGNEGASASSTGRSAGRAKEKAGKEEMEMEPVSSSNRSSAMTASAGNGSKRSSGSERSGQPKASASPRSESGRSSSSRKSTTTASASKTSGRSNGRSSSGGRGGKSTSRGRK
jgi:ferritin-like metal-binding protein YciE